MAAELEQLHDASHARAIGALDAQRVFTFAALAGGPAVAAGTIAMLHGERLAFAALIAGLVLLANSAILRQPIPFHLMPLSWLAVRLLAPLAAVLAAVGIAAGLSDQVNPMQLAPLFGAWLVTFAADICLRRFYPALAARVAVVGSPALVASLRAEFERAHVRDYRVVGWIGIDPGAEEGLGGARLGDVSEISSILRKRRIDLVVFGVRESGFERHEGTSIAALEEVTTACLATGVRVIGANQLYETFFGHVPVATINAAWFQYVMHPRFRPASPLSKRAFDLVVSTILGLLAAPIVAVAAIAIKLEDGGPILYRQRRLGEGGSEFDIVKLRTMRADAERDGPVWSMQADTRVTRVGRFLRRSHFDELPQLWNVIRGQMSMVGPRPERPEFVGELEQRLAYYDRRLLIRPGITGWAQVRVGYAGSDDGTAWKLAHDLFYLKRRSVGFDLMIVLETTLTPIRDAQVVAHLPDPTFVVEAARQKA